MNYTEKLWKLEDERRAIEQRIHIRAALHRAGWIPGKTADPIGVIDVMDAHTGKERKLTQEDMNDVNAHGTHEDALRYIELEDKAWALIGGKDQKGIHESVPE